MGGKKERKRDGERQKRDREAERGEKRKGRKAGGAAELPVTISARLLVLMCGVAYELLRIQGFCSRFCLSLFPVVPVLCYTMHRHIPTTRSVSGFTELGYCLERHVPNNLFVGGMDCVCIMLKNRRSRKNSAYHMNTRSIM